MFDACEFIALKFLKSLYLRAFKKFLFLIPCLSPFSIHLPIPLLNPSQLHQLSLRVGKSYDSHFGDCF